MSDEQFKDKTTLNTTAGRTVSDGVPRVAVKFDDGRKAAYTNGQVQAFLRRGIPVTLALNSWAITRESNGTVSGSRMTWAEIRDLMSFAAQSGTHLDIANHTYSNWNADDEGAGASAPWTMGYDDYLMELQNDTIQAHLGVTPKVFVYPGDPKAFSWMIRQRDIVSDTLDSLGYSFAITGGNADSLGTDKFVPSAIAMDVLTGASNNSVTMIRPGILTDPFWIHGGMPDLDLSVSFVERDGTEGSGADSWLLRDFGGNSVSQWQKGFAYRYSVRLANNAGFVVTLHDSVASNTAVSDLGDNNWISGITGTEGNGHLSPDHIAWALKSLHDAGHIKLVSLAEWCEWVLSSYAPGTDLIDNPKCENPQWVIGDTLGTELGWVRGWGSYAWQTSTWGASAAPVANYDAGAGNAAKFDRTQDDPSDNTGDAVVGFLGRTGGLAPAPGANYHIMQGLLPPGRYRLSFQQTHPGNDINLREFQIAAAGLSYNPEALWGGATASAYGDTLISYRWRDSDANAYTRPAAMDEQWVNDAFEFTLPTYPMMRSTDLDNTLSPLWGSDAESPGLYNQMWLGRWTWAIALQFQQSSPNHRISNAQLRYLGPVSR